MRPQGADCGDSASFNDGAAGQGGRLIRDVTASPAPESLAFEMQAAEAAMATDRESDASWPRITPIRVRRPSRTLARVDRHHPVVRPGTSARSCGQRPLILTDRKCARRQVRPAICGIAPCLQLADRSAARAVPAATPGATPQVLSRSRHWLSRGGSNVRVSSPTERFRSQKC